MRRKIWHTSSHKDGKFCILCRFFFTFARLNTHTHMVTLVRIAKHLRHILCVHNAVHPSSYTVVMKLVNCPFDDVHFPFFSCVFFIIFHFRFAYAIWNCMWHRLWIRFSTFYDGICEGMDIQRIGYAFLFGLFFICVNDNNDVTFPLSPFR